MDYRTNKKPSQAITLEQLDAMRKASDDSTSLMLLLMARGGLRVSEVLSLQWTDICGSKIVLRKCNTKGKTATREINLTKGDMRELNRYRIVHDPVQVFEGKIFPFTRMTAHRRIKKACEQAGIDHKALRVQTHSLRKLGGQMVYRAVYEKTGDGFIAANAARVFLGHSDVNTTVRYLEVAQQYEIDLAATSWDI